MITASNSVTIKRPTADVFAFLANPENDTAWRKGLLEMKHLSGTGSGARYHQVIAGPGGRRISADIEIVEFRPGRLIAFHTTSGPVRPSGQYSFADEGSATILTFSLAAELGIAKRLVMGAMVAKSMRAEVAQLANLKQVLEQASPATPE